MNLFIEESVFLLEDFYTLLERYKEENKDDTITIYLEENIENNANDLLHVKDYRSGYSILNYITLVSQLFKVRFIDTNNYLDTSSFHTILAQSNEDLIILLQSKSTVKNFQTFAQDENIKLLKFNGKTTEPWYIASDKNSAFYVESTAYLAKPHEDKFNYVFSPRYGYLALSDTPIYEGGEGYIYRTYNNMLAKVYKEKHLTYQNYLKLKSMINMEVFNASIIWPNDIIYYRSHFIGYLMDEISDAEVMDDLRDYSFGDYTPRDRVKIALEFLKIIDYLHNRNIVVGDLKFDNILVKNSNELYIIDTGSFQVQDYPCVVYNLEFSEYAYEEDELKKVLRTQESEYFAINKILYEILMLKNPFYNADNIEIDPENERNFTLTLKPPNFTQKPPHHLQMWFSLDTKIRESFYYYFKEKKITYVPELIKSFSIFYDKISKETVHGR